MVRLRNLRELVTVFTVDDMSGQWGVLPVTMAVLPLSFTELEHLADLNTQ